jgi:hypothetical protein
MMNLPRWSLELFTVLAALSGGAARAEEAAGSEPGPRVHTLAWDRVGVWKGHALGPHRIEAFAASDRFQREDGSAPGAWTTLFELTVAGPDRSHAVRCAFDFGPADRLAGACDLVPSDGGAPAALVFAPGQRGRLLRGETELEVEATFLVTEALRLRLLRPDGTLVASWAQGLIPKPELVAHARDGGEEELAALVTLTMLPLGLEGLNGFGLRDARAFFLDTYPLVERGPREDAGPRALVARLEARGARAEASLLARHLAETRTLDLAAGTYLERHPWHPRVMGGVYGGSSWSPDDGALRGGRAAVLGGVRLAALTLGLSLGFGVEGPGPVVGLGFDVERLTFAFGLEGRYAHPLFGALEGVVGVSAAASLRVTSVPSWGEGLGATQVGARLGPIVGLQAPVWAINDAGSRLVLAFEGVPEWGLWASPNVTAPPGVAGDPVREALSRNDFALRLHVLARFEL